jgi:hypothetical protein
MIFVEYSQTALFAGVQTQMIAMFPVDHSSASDTTLRFFAYTGLALNLGATLSSILLLVAVVSLPTTARHIYMMCDHGYPRKLFEKDDAHILELNDRMLNGHGETYALDAFGIARGWSFMLRHCIFCFLGGCICIFLHIAITVWLTQSTLVAALVMPGIVLGLGPPVVTFLFYMDSSRCQNCVEGHNARYVVHFVYTTIMANIPLEVI